MRFLFVDRITDIVPGVFARGLKHVTRDDYYVNQDHHGAWCFVPTLMGEALGQLAAWNVMMSNGFVARPVAGIAAKAALLRPVYVGETLILEAHIDALDDTVVQYHGDAFVGEEMVFRLEGAFGPLLPMTDFVDEAVVRRQFDEINRPGPVCFNDYFSLGKVYDEDLSLISHAPRMMFDRVIDSEPGVRMKAVKCISRAAVYFPDHFANKPVLPMTVLLACFLNLAETFIVSAGFTGRYVCREMRRVKMNGFIYPGDIFVGMMTLKHQTEREFFLTCRCEVLDQRVGVMELVMVLEDEK